MIGGFPKIINLWQGESGVNNPCPAGFRLPTSTELETEENSWASNDSAGAFASPLKLVAAGYRLRSDGTVYGAGRYGLYWSSTVYGSNSRVLYFYGLSAEVYPEGNHANGWSVRCLED